MIYLVLPTLHCAVFEPLARALCAVLCDNFSLAAECVQFSPERFKHNQVGDVYLLYGAHAPSFSFDFDNLAFIIINFEQASSPYANWECYLDRIKKSVAIVDYSLVNAARWRETVPQVPLFVCPLGHHPTFCSLGSQSANSQPSGSFQPLACHPSAVEKTPRKTLDVLMFGTPHPRREAVIQQLRTEGWAAELVSNLFGEALWEKIASSRIVINVHFYMPCILEQSRLAPLVSSGVMVVSESTEECWIQEQYKDCSVFSSLDDLTRTCSSFLKETSRCHAFAQQAQQRFQRRCSFSDFVSQSGLLLLLKPYGASSRGQKTDEFVC